MLSLAGWVVAERLKFPAATFLGPMFFVGATAIVGLPQPTYPPEAILLLQATFGVFLGCMADRDSVLRIRAMGAPVAITALWTVVTSFILAFVLAHTTGLDVKTAFLSTVPGGIPEMSAMSIAMGGNTAIVVAMQTLRVIAIMGAFPLLTKRAVATRAAQPGDPSRAGSLAADGRRGPAGWLISLALGLTGGVTLAFLQVPAGGILGSMAVVAVGRVAGFGLTRPPAWLRLVAMFGISSYVGTTLSYHTLVELRDIAVPAVIVSLGILVSGLALARFVQLRSSMDYATALLACAPAGVSQMVIIADELGTDPLTVTVFQLTRLMVCVFVMPVLFALFI
jgi:hypothetical protein